MSRREIFLIARCSRRLDAGVTVSVILFLWHVLQMLLHYPSFLIVFGAGA